MTQPHPPAFVTVTVTFILLVVYIGTCASSSLTGDTGRQASIQDDGLQQAQGVTVVHGGCGGIVSVPSTGNVTIDYRAGRGGQYGEQNERCIWTIVPEGNVALHDMIVFVEHQELESEKDGLIMYTWNGADTFAARRIFPGDTGTILTLPTQHAFLYFSSAAPLPAASGFKVTIVAVRGGTALQKKTFFYVTQPCRQEIFYPSFQATAYNVNERASFVLQPDGGAVPVMTNVEIVSLDTEANKDVLEMYALPPYSTEEDFVLVGRYSGSEKNVTISSIVDPLLVLFSSDGVTNKRGFHLNWYQQTPPAVRGGERCA